MDKELYLIAHGVAETYVHNDGEAVYAIYEALERAYALGVKDHTDDARRTSYDDGYKAGIEEGAFRAYLDCELNGTGPVRDGSLTYTPKVNAQLEGFEPEPRVIYVDPRDPGQVNYNPNAIYVDSHGMASFGKPLDADRELHAAVAALG